MADIANEVMEIIASKVKTANHKVSPTDPIDSLGLESIDFLEILLDIEQRFDIEIPYNANVKPEFKTVGEMVGAVERLVEDRVTSK
jgi:acyl carrier protein